VTALADNRSSVQQAPVPPEAPGRGLVADLREVASDLWHYRGLLFQLTLRDVRIRYKQAAMGFAWAALMPMLVVLAGCVVRIAIVQLSDGTFERTSIAAMAVKAVPWAFFVGSITFATTSLTGNINLVAKVYFPREVLPISSTLAQLADATVAGAAVALLLLVLRTPLTPALLWVPVLGLLLIIVTAAAALLLSCANLFFRDVKYIVQVFLTFGIFFTPVLFEPAMLGPRWAPLMMLNPLSPLLEGFRLAVVEGHSLLTPLIVTTRAGVDVLAWTPWYLGYTAAVGALALVGSALLFHRLEFLFAEYV
jgi:lipopolysaccharide transport system permease protein